MLAANAFQKDAVRPESRVDFRGAYFFGKDIYTDIYPYKIDRTAENLVQYARTKGKGFYKCVG